MIRGVADGNLTGFGSSAGINKSLVIHFEKINQQSSKLNCLVWVSNQILIWWKAARKQVHKFQWKVHTFEEFEISYSLLLQFVFNSQRLFVIVIIYVHRTVDSATTN